MSPQSSSSSSSVEYFQLLIVSKAWVISLLNSTFFLYYGSLPGLLALSQNKYFFSCCGLSCLFIVNYIIFYINCFVNLNKYFILRFLWILILLFDLLFYCFPAYLKYYNLIFFSVYVVLIFFYLEQKNSFSNFPVMSSAYLFMLTFSFSVFQF